MNDAYVYAPNAIVRARRAPRDRLPPSPSHQRGRRSLHRSEPPRRERGSWPSPRSAVLPGIWTTTACGRAPRPVLHRQGRRRAVTLPGARWLRAAGPDATLETGGPPQGGFMTTTPDWTSVLDAVAAAGWTARVVAADRMDELWSRVAGVLASGELPGPTADHLSDELAFAWPDSAPAPRSVVVAATPRPLTRATLTSGGESHEIVVPPHYAGYHIGAGRPRRGARGGARAVRATPRRGSNRRSRPSPHAPGCRATGATTSPTCPGLGSYLMLAACASDAPPPGDVPVDGAASSSTRCERCSACVRACPERRHPRGPVPPPDRPLPHLGERG